MAMGYSVCTGVVCSGALSELPEQEDDAMATTAEATDIITVRSFLLQFIGIGIFTSQNYMQ